MVVFSERQTKAGFMVPAVRARVTERTGLTVSGVLCGQRNTNLTGRSRSLEHTVGDFKSFKM